MTHEPTRITRMTIGELRCERCEAQVDRADDCYECAVTSRKAQEQASLKQVTRKTHCLRGHEYTEENTRMDANGASSYQVCRSCHNARGKATRERRRLRRTTQ
jgi:hypothetical protein